MFEQFPKQRPALPQAIQDIYAEQYHSNRKGGTSAATLAQRMEAWMHHQVAKDSSAHKVTLELGAGTLNQLQYEPNSLIYDIVEPFHSLYKDSPELHRIRHRYDDVAQIALDTKYNRITSVAVLEHICNLPEVIARCALLLSKDGVFHASIPSEGTWLWTLGWKLTTGLEFNWRHGLDYGLLMKHEHVNTASEIESVLRYFFTDVKFKCFGVGPSASFYQYFECIKPNIVRCSAYVA